MTIPWQIRSLADEDVEPVAAVLGLARLGQGDGRYVVAWEGDDPIGHAYLALTDPPQLQDVEVLPAYRRRGVASALAEAVERHAAVRGFERLRVEVSVDNAAAQAMYRKRGYRDAGLPAKRIRGTIMIRSGPLELDDTLVIWEKPLGQEREGSG